MRERQQKFVELLLADPEMNATQAYIDAGYKCRGHAAESAASRLLRNVEVKSVLEASKEKRAKKAEINAEWVLKMLVRNVKRAMQVIPVLDHEGNPTGEYKYDGSVANRALELIGKHVGDDMFPDTVRYKDVSDGELDRRIDERAERLRERRERIRQLAERARAEANGHASAAATFSSNGHASSE